MILTNDKGHFCEHCDVPALSERGRWVYREIGLEEVLLQNVLVVRCPKCSDHILSIDRMTELHDEIAAALLRQDEALKPPQIAFLRKHFNQTERAIAARMAVTPETWSRYENGKLKFRTQTERLFRLLCLVWLGSFPAVTSAVANNVKWERSRTTKRLHFLFDEDEKTWRCVP